MAGNPLPEIFSDVKLIIDPATIDYETDSSIRNSMITKQEGKNIVVSGSFEKVNDVYMKCMRGQRPHDTFKDFGKAERSLKGQTKAGPGPAPAPAPSSSSPSVQPVEVEETVMQYIKEKKSKELDKIKEKAYLIELNKRQVTFSSLNSKNINAQFAREQFITLYQKTATGLQTRKYSIDSKTMLNSEFSELMITKQDHKSLTVTGSFLSLERFDACLKESAKRSSKCQTSNKTRDYSTPSKQPMTQRETDQTKEETCPICFDTLTKLECKVLPKCKHSFCTECLKRAFQIKPACPVCGEIYGKLTGTQPKGGTMTVTRTNSSLPGYENYGTITIRYYIPSGVQGDEHPNPGHQYHGASRTAYLPSSPEGKKVLELLERAFNQRLIFTIGRSSTSGANNMVTWNDIHHKTSTYGGPTCYGYPDPDYLKRVQDELKAKGIY